MPSQVRASTVTRKRRTLSNTGPPPSKKPRKESPLSKSQTRLPFAGPVRALPTPTPSVEASRPAAIAVDLLDNELSEEEEVLKPEDSTIAAKDRTEFLIN